MILRSFTRPDGHTVTLSRSELGYRVDITSEGHRVSGLDLSPRSSAQAFEHFVTKASASGHLGALYPEILAAVAVTGATRSVIESVLGPTHRANEEGAAAVGRALSRLAEKTGDDRIRGLATRVHALHAAAVLALPEDVRAPLSDATEVRS